MTNTAAPAPQPGMGATQHYVTDSRALVITRVSASGRTLWTRAVELGPVRHEHDVTGTDEPPVTLQDGILNKPYGPERQWRLNGRGRWANGGERITIGHSVRRVDHKM